MRTRRLLMAQFRLLGLHVDADPTYQPGGATGFNLAFSAHSKWSEDGNLALFLRVAAEPHEAVTLPFTQLVAVGLGTFALAEGQIGDGNAPDDVQVDAAEAVYGEIRAAVVSATAAMPGGPHRLNPIDWDSADIALHPRGAVNPDLQAYTGQ